MEIARADLRIGDYKIECDPSSGDENEDRVWLGDSLSDNVETRTVIGEARDAGRSDEESTHRAKREIFAKDAKSTDGIYGVTGVVPSELPQPSPSIKKETEDFDASSTRDGRDSSEDVPKVGVKGAARDESSAREVTEFSTAKENGSRGCSPKRRDRARKETRLYGAERCEDARRRETYYETPEKRRKRLDNEAARKREYRMYNETSEERRKRLDREAERRRSKRSTIYATETPEERRERLNRESSRRRESRLNQYANETDEDRQLRLEKDASRAREMRFTRTAIESDEERRVRLLKDALRKRELRMRHGDDRIRNLVEFRTMMNFDELKNEPAERRSHEATEQQDNFTGHCVGNWMMWFQNTIGESNEADNRRTRTDA